MTLATERYAAVSRLWSENTRIEQDLKLASVLSDEVYNKYSLHDRQLNAVMQRRSAVR